MVREYRSALVLAAALLMCGACGDDDNDGGSRAQLLGPTATTGARGQGPDGSTVPSGAGNQPAPNPPPPNLPPIPAPNPPPGPAPLPAPNPPGPPLALTGMVTGLAGTCPNLMFFLDRRTAFTDRETRFLIGTCFGVRAGMAVAVEGRLQPDGSIRVLSVNSSR